MKYGDVQTITENKWAKHYRYKVSNGVLLVHINLKKHIPSQKYIAGTKILITYEGQLSTYYNCNEDGLFFRSVHIEEDIIPIHQECLNRIMSHRTARLPEAANIVFETPIAPGELH
jgi:UDP-galactopyranose mutase